MPKLTKRVVDASAATDRDYFVWDDELPGFGLRVFPTGKRSYLIQYRAVNRTRIIKQEPAAGTPLPLSAFTLRSPGGPSQFDREDIALANARRAIRRRILRRQLIGTEELFGDPAWEMLVDLFIHECERKRLSVSALCVTASIPMSSALRLAQKLCDAGITRRVPDPIDGRRTFIRLEPVIAHRIRAYFETGFD